MAFFDSFPTIWKNSNRGLQNSESKYTLWSHSGPSLRTHENLEYPRRTVKFKVKILNLHLRKTHASQKIMKIHQNKDELKIKVERKKFTFLDQILIVYIGSQLNDRVLPFFHLNPVAIYLLLHLLARSVLVPGQLR